MDTGKTYSSSVEEQASRWAARLDGGLPDEEREAFRRWLDEDSSHAACLHQYKRMSSRLDDSLPALVRAGAIEMPETVRMERGRGWIWMTGLAAAAGLAVALGAWFHQRPEVVAVTPGSQQTLALADGSRAEVNAGTTLRVEITKAERRVHLLSGEAMFSVVHDPSRPFIVETPDGIVRDIGTVFNVRAAKGRLEVTVLEGSVQVEPQSPGTRIVSLVAGQQVSIDADTEHVRELGQATVSDIVAWRNGGVVFDGVPLEAALDRFARYNDLAVSASPDVADMRLGGRFSLADADGFLGALEAALPVRVDRLADGSVRVTARAAAEPR